MLVNFVLVFAKFTHFYGTKFQVKNCIQDVIVTYAYSLLQVMYDIWENNIWENVKVTQL